MSGTAIVTGASGGIGRAVARRLAHDGFAVVVGYAGRANTAEETVTEIVELGGRAAPVQADVASAADVERLFRTAMDTFGPVDVVVHCAGIMPLRPIAGGDVEIFDKVIATNLRGTFLVLAQAAQHLSSGGRIIAFSTDSGSSDAVTYSLADDAGGLFAIDPTSGVVTVAGALDAETATSHQIVVQASDGTHTSSETFTIEVLDVNEFAPTTPTDADPATNEVAEDATLGATDAATEAEPVRVGPDKAQPVRETASPETVAKTEPAIQPREEAAPTPPAVSTTEATPTRAEAVPVDSVAEPAPIEALIKSEQAAGVQAASTPLQARDVAAIASSETPQGEAVGAVTVTAPAEADAGIGLRVTF